MKNTGVSSDSAIKQNRVDLQPFLGVFIMTRISIITLTFLMAFDSANATGITGFSATGTTFKFAVSLDAPLLTGYKVKIDFGKGLKTMSCLATSCTLTSSSLPSNLTTASYNVGIYNNKNVLQGVITEGLYAIKSTSMTSNTTIPSGTGYTKIANDGSILEDTAKLGTDTKDWACTKDNKTGLIWEVKTVDGGSRDARSIYSGYTEDYDPYNLI